MEELRRAYGVSEIVIGRAVSLLRLRAWWKHAAAAAPSCGPGRRSGGGRWKGMPPMRGTPPSGTPRAPPGRLIRAPPSPMTMHWSGRNISCTSTCGSNGGRGAGRAVRRRTGNGPAARAFRVLRAGGTGTAQRQLSPAGSRGGRPGGRSRARTMAGRDVCTVGIPRPTSVTGGGIGPRPDARRVRGTDPAGGAGGTGFRDPPAPHFRGDGAGGQPHMVIPANRVVLKYGIDVGVPGPGTYRNGARGVFGRRPVRRWGPCCRLSVCGLAHPAVRLGVQGSRPAPCCTVLASSPG